VPIERRTKLYRRQRGTTSWHFLPECPQWPTGVFEERTFPVKGGKLCPSCAEGPNGRIPKRRKGDFE
jgi:hypothetical protein